MSDMHLVMDIGSKDIKQESNRKGFGRGLLVKTIERSDREKRSKLDDCFQLQCVGIDVPVIVIKAIPGPEYEFITDKIIGPDAQWNL